MAQSYFCQNTACGQETPLTGIGQEDGQMFAICSRCGAKNLLELLPKLEGQPMQFRIVGLHQPPGK